MSIKKKDQLRNSHEKKLMELYDVYYQKCLNGDNSSLKPFLDCYKELFGEDEEDNELMDILKNINLE